MLCLRDSHFKTGYLTEDVQNATKQRKSISLHLAHQYIKPVMLADFGPDNYVGIDSQSGTLMMLMLPLRLCLCFLPLPLPLPLIISLLSLNLNLSLRLKG